MLVGIKPTVGRISRWGIIPITADQDTAGPMARTVTDAAIMLGAMEGADAHDPATTRCSPARGRDYQQFLWLAGLRGKRIGIPACVLLRRDHAARRHERERRPQAAQRRHSGCWRDRR